MKTQKKLLLLFTSKKQIEKMLKDELISKMLLLV